MACDPKTLASESSCFFCLPPGYYYPIKLAILARWLKSLNPAADTSVAALLADASAACVACPPGAQLGPLRLALVCSVSTSQEPPANFNLDQTSTNGAIKLNWTQPSAPTTNEVWRSVNGAAFALFNSVAGALTTYTDPTVYPGNTLVEYKVRAVGTLGNSAFTIVRGALRAQDDSAAAGPTVTYPTVQIIITSYTLALSVGINTLTFPELLYAINAPFCIMDLSASQLFEVDCPKLRKVGSISLNGSFNFTLLDLTALQTVDTNLDFNATTLARLVCPNLTSVGGFIDMTNVPFSGPVSLPLLQSVGSDLVFNGTSGITAINLSSLQTVGGTLPFDFGGATSFTSISLPALTSITNALALLDATSCLTFTANALTTITNGVCQINNNTALQSVSMNACTAVGGILEFANNPNLTTINMAALTTVGAVTADDLAISTCPNLTSINFNSLVHVDQTLGINGTALKVISLPALTNVGEDLTLGGFSPNNSLTSISLPVFVSFNGNLGCGGQPLLSSFNAPSIIFTDGVVIGLNNCALNAASVNQVLARGVASGVTTCTFELAGGTNAAPTGQGILDKATLIGLGNTVNTN